MNLNTLKTFFLTQTRQNFRLDIIKIKTKFKHVVYKG